MQAKEHKDYQEELEKLVETKGWIHNQSQILAEDRQKLEKEISDLKKEVSSAFDERLVLKEQMKSMTAEEFNQLGRVKTSPYFGRINFKENYGKEVEIVYIGKFGLYDAKAGDMLVLDWRTPMANIYYSGIDEDVHYKAPNGIIEGKMLLKRRYVITEGELIEIHDEKSLQDNLKETIEKDTGFLIDSLNKSTSGRLKEIVATIQSQQNQIIRSASYWPLIVQGVAGSGKTTIALHRMAYLIYNEQNPNAHYMVMAPNKLFLNYIEDILPDLGVEHVNQTTFEEWAMQILGKEVKLRINEDKLDVLLTANQEQKEVLALSSKLRGSILLKKIIDLKLKRLEKNLLSKEGICFEEINILNFKEIQSVFLTSNVHLSFKERIELLGNYIKGRLKGRIPYIEEAIEMSYRRKIDVAKASHTDIEERRKEIIALYDERDEKLKQVKRWIPNITKEYISAIKIPTTKEFYCSLFKDVDGLCLLLEGKIPEERLRLVVMGLNSMYEAGEFETEDLGPLVYIKFALYGYGKTQKYAHIVVDEAQDLDEMKLVVLRKVSYNDSFTLVGDVSQGIYDYKGITSWERMMERVFEEKKYQYEVMTTSYRSTVEIIELANKVISQCKTFTPVLAQPVLRHGEAPQIIQVADEDERLEALIKDIEEYQKIGMTSISILTKTEQEAKVLYEQLVQKKIKLQLLCNEEVSYEGGVAIMPSYISKGLEFDVVLIAQVSEREFSGEEREIKLLYVMITRALHYLKLYSIGKCVTFLEQPVC